MNCWGWATWQDRWQYFEKKPDTLIENWSKPEIIKFNLDGTYDFWRQVKLNHGGRLNTWAIFWYATIFQHNGLCFNPSKTYTINIGHDGTGENCRKSKYASTGQLANTNSDLQFPKDVCESLVALERIKTMLKGTTLQDKVMGLIRYLKYFFEDLLYKWIH